MAMNAPSRSPRRYGLRVHSICPSFASFDTSSVDVGTHDDHLGTVRHESGDLLLPHSASAYDDDSPSAEIEENGIVQGHKNLLSAY